METPSVIRQDLISVVVPIYNVELYIERCINSLLAQTYKKLEIILVDDGSTDSSPKFCDRYCEMYDNVKVVHKENGGLSSARNAGIEQMSGKYVLFIDSDDFIDQDMISRLYSVAQEQNADIVTCQFIKYYEDRPEEYYSEKKEMSIWTGEEALAQMFYPGGIGWSACNKLYRSELFAHVRYVEGIYWEDMATTYLLYEQCKKVVETPYRLYYYCIRTTGITGNKSSKRAHDAICTIETVSAYFENHYPHLAMFPHAFYGKTAPNFLATLCKNGDYPDFQLKCVKALKQYWKLAVKADFVKVKYKFVIIAFRFLVLFFGEKIVDRRFFIYFCKKIGKFLK